MSKLGILRIPLFLVWQEMIFYVMVYGKMDRTLWEAVVLVFLQECYVMWCFPF